MIPPLNEMVGLPLATSPVELDCASEQYFQTLLRRAAHGETSAQDELVRLRVAYLNWAYLGRKAEEAVVCLHYLPGATILAPDLLSQATQSNR